MADTSLTIAADTKERLKDYRASGHESWSDVLEGLMEIVPPAEDILDPEACGWAECDEPLWVPDTPEKRSGVIYWWYDEDHDGYGNAYFCSPEHAAKQAERMDEMMPSEPDKVIIGGVNEPQVEIPNARFHFAAHPKEIGFDIPGALTGEPSHRDEYDYIGEPVYVWNAGKVRHSAVVDEIVHEDGHTGIFLGRSIETEMENHPNDERREEWLENRAEADEA